MSKKIELKATGETITFIKTGVETNGELVECIITLPASGEGPPPHRHILQTELFEAIEGRLGLMCEGEKMVLEPGDSFLVPENALHSCFAVEGEDIKFKATFKPALSIEYVLTEIFEACNRRGSKDPSPFEGSYVLSQVKGEYLLGDIPVFIQTTVFPIVASIGKLLGLVKASPRKDYPS